MLSSLTAQPVAIPGDLRKELPDAWVPWQINDRLFQEMKGVKGTYKKVQVLPTDPEWRFVWRYFHHDKPTRYGLKRVFCVHERHQQQAFELNLAAIEREADKFAATWKEEPRADVRQVVMARWQQTVQGFSPFQTMESDGRRRSWEKTKVLPLWHGSSEQVCRSIAESGFVYFGKTNLGSTHSQDPKSTDEGYFGSGIYFTNSARYAADIYAKGHLIMAWVSMREPFPVVGDAQQSDMAHLKGKGAYKHYNAHYIPVVPTENTPACAIYYPCQAGQAPVCDEVVVFQKAQALPRFWIELEVELPYLMTPSEVPQYVEDLIPHLLKVLQHPQVDKDRKLRNCLNQELAFLLKLPGDDYLEEKHTVLFEQLMQLIDQGGKINQTVQKLLVGASPASSASQGSVLPPPADKVSLPKIASVPQKPAKPALAFGAAEWAEYLGDVGDEPPLPADIASLLSSPCPFWPGKRVEETHLLCLIPATVNGRPLTLMTLRGLVQAPKKGHATQYRLINDGIVEQVGQQAPLKSHWALMTQDVIPGSRSMTYSEQQALLAKGGSGYEVPSLLEAVTCTFLTYVRFQKRLFADQPWTYTRCRERVGGCQTAMGGCSSAGLDVISSFDNAALGLAALRKF